MSSVSRVGYIERKSIATDKQVDTAASTSNKSQQFIKRIAGQCDVGTITI